MRRDQPSSTAAVVAAARALIDRDASVDDFEDPYAEQLLPGLYRGVLSVPGFSHLLEPAARHFALRTAAIDDALRHTSGLEQVVILGAGLDARGWRMSDLREIPVFEVDHPSTQRYKKGLVASWERHPEHEFVAVDFQTDSLGGRLEEAGHDPKKVTVWVWEGVTMYLDLDAIDATLSTLARRSAPGSRLLVTYVEPSLAYTAIGLATRIFGEPLKTASKPDDMHTLLAEHGFELRRDTSGVDWRDRWAPDQWHLPAPIIAAEHLAVANRR